MVTLLQANNMECKFEGAGHVLPEIEAYCYLLALLLLIDQKSNQVVIAWSYGWGRAYSAGRLLWNATAL